MERGRPKKLTSKMADQIIHCQLDRMKKGTPMLKAPAMRKNLLRMYRENFREQGMADDKIRSKVEHADKELFPGVSTIQKFIAQIKDSPLDQPFGLGALVKHPIPPEALPMVMRVWAGQTGEEDGFTWSSGFSIRDALWVSRLSHLYDEIKETKARAEAILGVAVWYSVRERAYEAIGKDIDTTDFDTVLLENFKLAPITNKRKSKKEVNQNER